MYRIAIFFAVTYRSHYMLYRIHYIIIIFLLHFFASYTYAWSARVVAVTDGDTIVVTAHASNKRIRIRLYGIDAPERNQACGKNAKAFVMAISLHKRVNIMPLNTERYGRTVAIVFLSNGSSLQEHLLEMGLAWVWPRYCVNCKEWKALQKTAQQEKIGLWKSDAKALEPWKWRQRR